jgi:hypothetical protein
MYLFVCLIIYVFICLISYVFNYLFDNLLIYSCKIIMSIHCSVHLSRRVIVSRAGGPRAAKTADESLSIQVMGDPRGYEVLTSSLHPQCPPRALSAHGSSVVPKTRETSTSHEQQQEEQN